MNERKSAFLMKHRV